MRYSEFVKNSPEYGLLRAEARNPASGYLIVGKDGVFTDVLCRLFLSLVTNTDEARMEEGRADVEFFEGKFTVADAERISDKAYYTPIELKKKYFIIKCGEVFNDAAQNKLLKILEEPPRTTGFILITKEESYLLPTVRSRLKIIRCRPLSESDMSRLCDKYFENSLVAQALSGGSIERAEKFASAQYAELFRDVKSMLFNMKRSGDILTYAALLSSKRELLPDVLDILETVFHDCMVCSLGKYDGTLLKTSLGEIRELSHEYDAETVLRLRGVIDRARLRHQTGGNAVSVIDELLFNILEVKAKCQRL